MKKALQSSCWKISRAFIESLFVFKSIQPCSPLAPETGEKGTQWKFVTINLSFERDARLSEFVFCFLHSSALKYTGQWATARSLSNLLAIQLAVRVSRGSGKALQIHNHERSQQIELYVSLCEFSSLQTVNLHAIKISFRFKLCMHQNFRQKWEKAINSPFLRHEYSGREGELELIFRHARSRFFSAKLIIPRWKWSLVEFCNLNQENI